uniref:Uncharacterized protein n=1 Tax=Anopheles dirus TaxID=7168 RepID=A0A182NIP8_9DIPT
MASVGRTDETTPIARVLVAVAAAQDRDISVRHVPAADSFGADLLLLVCFLMTVVLVGFVLRLFLQMWRSRIECRLARQDMAAGRQLV